MAIPPNDRTAAFVGYFFRAYPWRTALMIGLLIIAGLLEGVGLVALLPLLELGTGRGEETSALTRAVSEGFRGVGLTPSLGLLLLVIVGTMTLKAIFVWLGMKQVGYTVAQVATDLRLRLIRALLSARWRFFVGEPAGSFANSIGTEARRASTGYQFACEGMAGLIQALIYLTVVFLVSWQVALVALLVAPVVFISLKGFVGMSRRAGEEQTTLMRELMARVTEILPGMKALKAMGRDRVVLPLLENEATEFNLAQRKAILAAESLRAFQEPAVVVVLASGLFVTVAFGSAPTTAVLVAAVLFYRVMTTANRLQQQYQQVTDKESAFWSLMNTLERVERAAEPPTRFETPVPLLRDEIRLDDVWFSYDEEPILRGVDLVIRAGELVTFVGASGSGKTTLVDVITGLLTPERGSVTVDAVPIDATNLESWRAQIGYVPQEMLLFHDTILRNVTLGEDRFTRDHVERALRAAGAWDFVVAHADGLERVVGERGSQLSGGQRQRIGLARALVSRPRLLVLDEATAALDPDTEAEICDNLLALREHCTIIAISHQEAIQRLSNRVYEMHGGDARPKEAGTVSAESGLASHSL